MSSILIIDDDPNCAKLWERVLEGQADTFLTANSLEQAMERMSTIPPPDLVLLDLKIPPHGPEHTLSAIKAFREYNQDLKVIAVSGMTADEINAAVRASGATIQGVVRKGDMDSQAKLLEAVQGLLASSKGFKDSMRVLQTVTDAIEKKRTDRIDLPPKAE